MQEDILKLIEIVKQLSASVRDLQILVDKIESEEYEDITGEISRGVF
jgi:hypothetical protein